MSTYSPFKRRSSSSAKTAQSPPAITIPQHPVYSSAIAESPVAATGLGHFDSPYTPPTARDPLIPLSEESTQLPFESHGSRAPLLRGSSTGATSPDISRDDASSVNIYDADSTALAPLPMPAKQQTTPLRIPPAGIHDPYVSRFLTPLDAGPSASRPAPLLRSSSMPGVPQSGLAASLLPRSPVDGNEEEVEGKLIFEVFDAQFELGADKMAKTLKGHLAEVLKMQEEVGKMHLALEGLRAPVAVEAGHHSSDVEGEDKSLEKREDGVEEIMRRLGAMSDELRKYHSLGTPKLSFPSQSARDTTHHSRSQSVDVRGTPPARRSPIAPKASPENEKTIPRAQSNLDKLTAGLNIDIPDSLRDSYPEYSTLQSPPGPRRTERSEGRKPTMPPEGGNLAQQATKRSLAQAWDRDPASQKDGAESEWVENMRKELDDGSANKAKP